MTRYRFGGVADYVISKGTDNVATLVPNTTVTCWNQPNGGVQYTDLTDTDGVTALATLKTDANGSVPEFYGPDSVTALYLDANGGSGPRRRTLATSVGDVAEGAAADLASHISDADTRYLRVGSGVFQVTTGDTGDDTASIQNALDAAATYGGGTVIIPAGRVYSISTYLTVGANVNIRAHGATIRAVADTGLLRNFVAGDSFTEYNGNGNIQIDGGTWDANASDGTSGVVTGLKDAFTFGHARNITLTGLTIQNVSGAHAVDLSGVSDAVIDGCRFEGFIDNTTDSSRGFSEAIQLDFAIASSGSVGENDGTPCRNINVSGCSFGSSDRLGPFGRAVGSHTSVSATAYCERVVIANNQIEGAGWEGIRAYAWQNAVISGNAISGTVKECIEVTGPDPLATGYAISCNGVVVTGNSLSGPSNGTPIRVDGYATSKPTGVHVADNITDGGPFSGIYISQADRPSVTANHLMNSGTAGIYVVNCTSPQVASNLVVAAAGSGIGVDTCVGGNVVGNTVDGTTNGGHGIYIGGGSDVSVTANRVFGAAGVGVRATSSTVRCRVRDNTILRGGVSTFGIQMTASATGGVVIGNDLSGETWPAGTAFSLDGLPVTDWSGGTAVPGLNLAATA